MRATRLPAGLVILLATAAAPALADVYAPVVPSLDDPSAVVSEMRSREAGDLPVEALAAYTAGIAAWHDGHSEEAASWLELAAALDPAFPEAHLALARIRLFREPKAALDSMTSAVRAAVSTFTGQHLLVVNMVFGLLLLIAVGFVALASYSAVRHLSLFHHSMAEVLRERFPGPLASIFGIALLAAPLLWRAGLLPLAFLFIGLLWPWMHRAERGWISGLGGALLLVPFLVWGASPMLYGPLDPAGRSFLLARAGTAAHSPQLVSALSEARAAAPKDPDLCFALAAVEKRGGDYDAAETHYREALGLGAPEAEVQNNLGVIAFLREDFNRALDLLQRSVANDPERAASHFNLSQTFAKKLFFEKADQELMQANRLSIGRVREALRDADGNPRRTVMDETVPPAAIWRAAAAGPRRMPSLPAAMTLWFPGSLWLLTVFGTICFGLGLRLGRRLHRHLPAMACTNCGRPVCRRCLKRIRQEVYCAPCGDILLRIQSTSYSKLVLDSQARRKRRVAAALLKASAWMLPGLHAARCGRDTLSALLVLSGVGAGLWLLNGTAPVTRLAWLEGLRTPWWPELPAALLILIFALSGLSVMRWKAATSRLRRPETNPALRGPEAQADQAA